MDTCSACVMAVERDSDPPMAQGLVQVPAIARVMASAMVKVKAAVPAMAMARVDGAETGNLDFPGEARF